MTNRVLTCFVLYLYVPQLNCIHTYVCLYDCVYVRQSFLSNARIVSKITISTG